MKLSKLSSRARPGTVVLMALLLVSPGCGGDADPPEIPGLLLEIYSHEPHLDRIEFAAWATDGERDPLCEPDLTTGACQADLNEKSVAGKDLEASPEYFLIHASRMCDEAKPCLFHFLGYRDGQEAPVVAGAKVLTVPASGRTEEMIWMGSPFADSDRDQDGYTRCMGEPNDRCDCDDENQQVNPFRGNC